MNGAPEGWAYEGPDPSAGILTGAWMHDCPDGAPEPIDTKAEPVGTRHEGTGFDRTVVITYRLTCTCGATATVDERDWDPEPGTEES